MSRRDPGRRPREPRRRRVVPATVCALVLGALGVTVTIDVVVVQTAGHALIWPYEQMARTLRTTTWGQSSAMAVAAAAGVVGLVLIAAGLAPAGKKLMSITPERDDEWVGVHRRSVRRALGVAARGVDGVTGADVQLGRRKARVDVSTPLRDPGDLYAQVRTAIDGRLTQMSLTDPLTVSLRIRNRVMSRRDAPLSSPPNETDGVKGTNQQESPLDTAKDLNTTSTTATHITDGEASEPAGVDERQRRDTGHATDLAETGGQGGAASGRGASPASGASSGSGASPASGASSGSGAPG